MKYLNILIFLLIFQFGQAQNSHELRFIEHLINKGSYKEVIHLLPSDSCYCNQNQLDSMFFYRGWAHYSLKNLNSSTVSFLKVGKESPFYLKSRFFAGYNQLFLEKYDESRNIFKQINIQDEGQKSLINFELSGIHMLKGEWVQARDQLKIINPDIAILSKQLSLLEEICKEQESRKQKSPLLAGLMSGIIPGSGKIYAGKTGEGIASMIATTGFGLITWENWHKLGLNNFKTIFFGSIFAATYISNIYGSVISVKIIENNYQHAIHNQILFQLHIPLRNFFE